MLVLTRKTSQSIRIGEEIEVTVLSISGEKVRLGIRAPRDVPVFREEVTGAAEQAAEASGDAQGDGGNAAPISP
jgi:carbon storage regulator